MLSSITRLFPQPARSQIGGCALTTGKPAARPNRLSLKRPSAPSGRFTDRLPSGRFSGRHTTRWCAPLRKKKMKSNAQQSLSCEMRHRIYLHITWTTRDREPAIDAASASLLRRLLPAIARQERAHILELGIVRTHVHVLLRVWPTTPIPRLVQRLKGGSSIIVNRERGSTVRQPLRWAKGYNVDSVSQRAVEKVRAYVRHQRAHHPDEAIGGNDHG